MGTKAKNEARQYFHREILGLPEGVREPNRAVRHDILHIPFEFSSR